MYYAHSPFILLFSLSPMPRIKAVILAYFFLASIVPGEE